MNKCFPFNKGFSNEKDLLFCFHHAGGSATQFRSWLEYISLIDVVPVELPGKATRRAEKYVESMAELVPHLAHAIAGICTNKRIYLFGHSMGAIIAYQVAHYLEKELKIKPRLLIAAARQAPQAPSMDRYTSAKGFDILLEELRWLNGTPNIILENKNIQEIILPEIRREYILNESYVYAGEKISCDICVHYGKEDPDLTEGALLGWRDVTTGSVDIKAYGGDHFFVYSHLKEYIESLGPLLV